VIHNCVVVVVVVVVVASVDGNDDDDDSDDDDYYLVFNGHRTRIICVNVNTGHLYLLQKCSLQQHT
jgi:hypothetical protein